MWQSTITVLEWWTGLVDWTGGLDWWTGLKIIFMLSNESLPVWLHLETQPLSFTDLAGIFNNYMTWSMHTQSYKTNLEASAIGNTSVDVDVLLVT